jgi:hypothetical protein
MSPGPPSVAARALPSAAHPWQPVHRRGSPTACTLFLASAKPRALLDTGLVAGARVLRPGVVVAVGIVILEVEVGVPRPRVLRERVVEGLFSDVNSAAPVVLGGIPRERVIPPPRSKPSLPFCRAMFWLSVLASPKTTKPEFSLLGRHVLAQPVVFALSRQSPRLCATSSLPARAAPCVQRPLALYDNEYGKGNLSMHYPLSSVSLNWESFSLNSNLGKPKTSARGFGLSNPRFARGHLRSPAATSTTTRSQGP